MATQILPLNGSSSLAASSATTSSITASSTLGVSDNINVTLDKATQSFDTKDFSETKDMLNQVGKIIANIDSGAVKGTSESGTTSTAGGDPAGTVGSSSGSK